MDPTPLPETLPALHRRRPWYRLVLHNVRRAHLFCGLFLLPWVILYGITAFLFNHPSAFSDQPTATFGRSALIDTPMASPPPPTEIAAKVVDALQTRAGAEAKYTLIEPERARYTRDFAFATVKVEGQLISVLMDPAGTGGTVRSGPVAAPRKVVEKAPFAIGTPSGAPGARMGQPGRGNRGGSPSPDTLKLDNPLNERIKAAIPAILTKTGFPTGEVTVTSVPDLAFRMQDGEKVWEVTYNAQTGSVSGKPADAEPVGEPLSARRFLTRLHTAHGYPGEPNAKWAWAVIVDAMAFVMLFWAASGLFMWWQLKATRKAGLIVLVLSTAAAAWVGIGMHEFLNAVGR